MLVAMKEFFFEAVCETKIVVGNNFLIALHLSEIDFSVGVIGAVETK
jgi:hypothetical protein